MDKLHIQTVLDRVLQYHLISTFVLIFVTTLCVLFVIKHNDHRAEKMGIISIVLIILICIKIFVSVIPFTKDYLENAIIAVECRYINNHPEEAVDNLGIYGVTIITSKDTWKLTTAPLHNQSDFPRGEFDVTAYYAENSKTLLYIEIYD